MRTTDSLDDCSADKVGYRSLLLPGGCDEELILDINEVFRIQDYLNIRVEDRTFRVASGRPLGATEQSINPAKCFSDTGRTFSQVVSGVEECLRCRMSPG